MSKPEKSSYPYEPFKDSLLGEKILLCWTSSNHKEQDLVDSLSHNLATDKFYFTPNAVKQTLMVRYPTEIRKFITNGDYEKVGDLLFKIAYGDLANDEPKALDICMELMEWLLTGFEIDKELGQYFSKLFSHSEIFSESFVENVRAEYVKELRG